MQCFADETPGVLIAYRIKSSPKKSTMEKEYIITSLQDFIDWIKCGYKEKVYYRGQASKDWNISPSVFRQNVKYDEHELLSQANLLLWNELKKYPTALEKMVFLQHYGLPTRLLDVTFNPLFALFFACSSNETADGAVYMGYRYINECSRVAKLIAEYVLNHQYHMTGDDLKRFAKKNKLSVEDFCNPCFILPPMNNPRIASQQGAFIMAPYAKNKELITQTILIQPVFLKSNEQ